MDKYPQQSKGQKLMRLLMFTVAISSMSALMFNIVLPQISKEFSLSIAEASWLSTAYTLIYAFGTVTYGKLADRFQLKNILTFGLLIFAIGSMVGLISHTFWVALLGRCLQSAGAAAIPASAMIIPIRYFPPERRGSALGMSAVGVAIGSALGPVVSALIVSVAHWRWLFVPPLLILITLPFYRKYLEHDPKKESGRFDWLGGGLLAAATGLLLLGITNRAWWLLIGGLAALPFFIARIRYAEEPFIQPKLFHNRTYTLGLTLIFLINAIGASLYFLTPILLADVYELDSKWIGFAMVPAAAASSILGRKGGKLADLKGNAYLFGIASASLMSCFVLLSTFTGALSAWIASFLILGNVGQSFMLIAMSNSISRTLPKEQVGVGMGLFSMINFISQGIASGVYSILIALGSSASWNPVNSYPNSYIYSNIYLVLAAMHVGILIFYNALFGRRKAAVQKTEADQANAEMD
ncbi:MFS transporter [Paenibacillus caui]|uniref:MFS transporter n=1 Tax=Paenibacillus caui TaxID=2873927 RepID=UPI001CA92598|nr:MFS transporter [Paenibacillus caui]